MKLKNFNCDETQKHKGEEGTAELGANTVFRQTN